MCRVRAPARVVTGWLARHGVTATLIENAPTLRSGGYVIDFWGTGFEVASRMGLLPHLLRTGYAVREVRVVDRNGQRVSGFPAAALARAVSSGFTSLPRGDLAAAVYGALRPFASMKQRAARRFAGALAPKSRMSLFLRNRLFGLFSIGWIAKLIAGREFSDRIALPDY